MKAKDVNYYFILKAKVNILLNCGQEKREEGLVLMKTMLQEIDEKEEGKTKLKWNKKKVKKQFIGEIIMTLKFWKDSGEINLEEEIENKLMALEKQCGTKNVFYKTILKNKFIFLYEKS